MAASQPNKATTGWEEEVAMMAAQERNQKLYDKVMLLHYILASEEDKERMAEPTGWRPLLPTNMSLEMQVRILQGKVDAMNRRPSAPPSAQSNPCKPSPSTPPQ